MFAVPLLLLVSFFASGFGLNYVENIKLPKTDDRKYRGFTLDNGIKAIVISDPDTDKSAAALRLNIGALSDPWDTQGMAHFCEHMLFMGSKKYPQEDGYHRFISDHGGSRNAFTSLEETTYFFSILPEFFEEAVDRLSRFFIDPLFTANAVQREVNAVNSEYHLSLKNDYRRMFSLQKALAEPDHDFRKFMVGSVDTLYNQPKAEGKDPRELVMKFHNKFYSANLMTVSLLGTQSIEELTQMVVDKFSLIANQNMTAPSWTNPLDESIVGKKIKMDTIKDTNDMILQFPIPDVRAFYESKPDEYITYLLSNENKGSVVGFLKKKGWIESMFGYLSTEAQGFGFAEFRLKLTEEGQKHEDEILLAIFQYINMLKKYGPQERLFKEIKIIKDIEFSYLEKGDPLRTVLNSVTALSRYPMDEVYSAEYEVKKYEPKLIENFMTYLNPDNLILYRTSNKFTDALDKKEKWYDVKYSVNDISKDLLGRLRDAGINPMFNLPLPNEYLPDNTDVQAKQPSSDNLPQLIVSNDLMTAWYQQDQVFNTPKAYINTQIVSSYSNLDPMHRALLSIMKDLFMDGLNEEFDKVYKAGLSYFARANYAGITISTSGFQSKLNLLTKRIIERFIAFKPDPVRFGALKAKQLRDLNNFNVSTALGQNYGNMNAFIQEGEWTNAQKIDGLKDVTVEDVAEYHKKFLSHIHLDILGTGDLLYDDMLSLTKDIQELFDSKVKYTTIPAKDVKTQRAVQLPTTGKPLVYQNEHPVDPDSSIIHLMQCGKQTDQDDVVSALLKQTMSTSVFDQLRTKEQLGYVASLSIPPMSGLDSFAVLVQSNKPPDFVQGRIDEFLKGRMLEELNNITPEKLQSLKDAVALKRFEKSKTLRTQHGKYWREIQSRRFNFDRPNVEKKILDEITLDQLKEKYLSCLLTDRPRTLSLYIVGSQSRDGGYSVTDTCNKDYKCIDQPEDFMRYLSLYPPVKPFKTVNDLEKNCKNDCKNPFK